MPTIAELKEELKALKVKGITGKNKAELVEMLQKAKGGGGGGGAPAPAKAAPPPAPAKMKQSVADIKEELKALKVKGITGKNKAELLEMLQKAKGGAAPAPAPAPAPKAGKGEITNAVANYYIKWLNGEKGKMTRETGEVKFSYVKYGRDLQYVSYNWNEPEITAVNKYEDGHSHIELTGTYKDLPFIVELLFEAPNKSGSKGTGVLIYSPRIPRIDKNNDDTLQLIAAKIVHQNAGKARMTADEIAEKDKAKEKRIREDEQRVARTAQRKADAEKARVDAEKAREQGKVSKKKRMDEIDSLVEEGVRMAKSGSDYTTLVRFYNNSIVPKLRFYGGEYLDSGEASEMGDEFLERMKDAMPPAPAAGGGGGSMSMRGEKMVIKMPVKTPTAEQKEIVVPRIKALPKEMVKTFMNDLAGMEETHEYKAGLGHPTDFVLKMVNRQYVRNDITDWNNNRDHYNKANDFYKAVMKYVKDKSIDATWNNEPQKMILLSDWGRIFE